MKISVLFIGLFALVMSLSASQADLFSYNSDELNDQFSELNNLENYVNSTENVSYDFVVNSEEFMSMNLSNSASNGMQAGFTFDDMDWAAFAWGFCCGGCGVLIVYLQKDKRTNERMISSLIGWGVAIVVQGISYAAQGGY